MSDDATHDLVKRTKSFALRVAKLVDALPKRRSSNVFGSQLLRSASSVSANYRAAKRARSKAEFVAKLGIVEEEADESQHWLEMIVDSGLMPRQRVESLIKESDELISIIVASIRTAKKRGK